MEGSPQQQKTLEARYDELHRVLAIAREVENRLENAIRRLDVVPPATAPSGVPTSPYTISNKPAGEVEGSVPLTARIAAVTDKIRQTLGNITSLLNLLDRAV